MVTLLLTGTYLILASASRSALGGVTDSLGGGPCCVIGYIIIAVGSIVLSLTPAKS